MVKQAIILYVQSDLINYNWHAYPSFAEGYGFYFWRASFIFQSAIYGRWLRPDFPETNGIS